MKIVAIKGVAWVIGSAMGLGAVGAGTYGVVSHYTDQHATYGQSQLEDQRRSSAQYANPVSVPEPGTLALLGAGLLVLSLAHKRKTRP